MNKSMNKNTICKLEARLQSLNKAVGELGPLCECQAEYDDETVLALGQELLSIWEQEFQKELDTGVRASMDWMAPTENQA